MNLDTAVRSHVSLVLKNAKESRAVIALKMEECSGQEVTEATLNNWTAGSKVSWRIPASLIPAFCFVTQDYTLFDLLLKPVGRRLATEDEERQSRLGRLVEERNRIDQEIERLKG